ncbi:hypothetical protein [Mesorhizobium sp. M0159]|uniref:hypothetical protein n=1 Tax=Mesorhizobium sp. M0159 TaxID=2956900 RepID=UPI00333D5D7E
MRPPTSNWSIPACCERYVTDSDGMVHVPSTYTVGRRPLIDGYPPEGRETYQRSIPAGDRARPGALRGALHLHLHVLQKLAFPIEVTAPTVYSDIVPAPATLTPLTPEAP